MLWGAGADPVEFGLVASYNHPGSNVTGVALLGTDVSGKRLELLRKLVPSAGLVAAFVGADNQFTQNETRELQSAAHVLGVRLLILNVPTYSDIAAAFSAIIEQQAGALLLSANVIFQQERDQIISLASAMRYRLCSTIARRPQPVLFRAMALTLAAHYTKPAFMQGASSRAKSPLTSRSYSRPSSSS